MRIQTIIPEPLLPEIDERAEAQGISRSTYVLNAIYFKMQYDDMMNVMPKMAKMLDQLKDAGYLDMKPQGKGELQ